MIRACLRRWAAVGAVLVAVGGSAACTADPADPPASSASTAGEPPVIVPGRPGESNTVVPPGKVRVPDDNAHNDSDVWFARAMIPHHEQAMQMATLAESRARSQQIRSLAARIKLAQEGEIAQMKAWLAARGLDERLSHHEHAAMRGMQTPAALRALGAANGGAFDRKFVAMMSDHHQGAIEMATEVLKGGRDLQIERLANEIAAEQASEITRMRDALAG